MQRSRRQGATAAVSMWGLTVRQHQLERVLGLVLWIAFALVLVRVAA